MARLALDSVSVIALRLLGDMDELVRDQPATGLGSRPVFALRERDVAAEREGPRADRA